MTIREVFEVTPHIQNIEVTLRENGHYVISYRIGEGVTPSRSSGFVEETEEGSLYKEHGGFGFATIVNPREIIEDHPERTIPKHVLDREIQWMRPWNVFRQKSEHYGFEFCCEIGEGKKPVPKPVKAAGDDQIEGQMSLEDFIDDI